MSESKLRDLSMDFSVQIINLVKDLKAKHESVISNQIGRSGTSIGANIFEANYAQGKKDFISKLEIALKEASETGYWLELLHRTGYIVDSTYKSLNDQCTVIRSFYGLVHFGELLYMTDLVYDGVFLFLGILCCHKTRPVFILLIDDKNAKGFDYDRHKYL